MLTEAQALKLAERADRRRGDGSRGPLARRAWLRLRQAGDEGVWVARETTWLVWLRSPSDDLWASLTQWREPGELSEAVFAAATDPARAAAARAAIGAFCARHGMAPVDAVGRVIFYALTGQAGQRRAADPDGSLLVAAYEAGTDPIRAELRRELADAGDIDLVRMLAGKRGGALSVEERDYLHDQLVRRRDWDRLWSIVRDLPLDEAAEVTRLFSDGWHPADDSGRRLFERFAATTEDAIGDARAALAAAQIIRIEVDGMVRAGSVAPDGRRVALWLAPRESGPGVVNVHTLPQGELAEQYELGGQPVCLTYTDEALLIADPPFPAARGASRLRRCRDGRVWNLAVDNSSPVTAIAPRFAGPGSAGGFAVLTGTQLLLYDGAGRRTGAVRLAAAPRAGAGSLAMGRQRWSLLASDPGGSLAAVSDSGALVVLDAFGSRTPQSLTYSTLSPGVNGICFAGSGTVVTTSESRVQFQPVPSPDTSYGTEARINGAHHPVLVALRDDPDAIAVLVGKGLVSYINTEKPSGDREVLPDDLAGEAGLCLFGTPDGRYHALGGDGSVAFAWPEAGELAKLASLPPTRWRPADFAAVSRVIASELCPDAEPLLRLMLASLEHRFGAELAIGSLRATAASDDIALSGS